MWKDTNIELILWNQKKKKFILCGALKPRINTSHTKTYIRFWKCSRMRRMDMKKKERKCKESWLLQQTLEMDLWECKEKKTNQKADIQSKYKRGIAKAKTRAF